MIQLANLDDIRAVIAPLQAQIAALQAQLAAPAGWVTVKEYAAQHCVSERTVHRMVARGEVECRRAGKILEILIDESGSGEPTKVDDDRPCCVYRYFDADNALIYVGVTVNFLSRDKSHVQNAWRDRADIAVVEWFPTRALALQAEFEAIRDEKPQANASRGLDQGIPKDQYDFYFCADKGRLVGTDCEYHWLPGATDEASIA